MKVYLIIGACGSGKTWVAKQLIQEFNLKNSHSAGLYVYREDDFEEMIVIGKYEDSMFDGSDRLSMAVMSSNAEAKAKFNGRIVIAEGDRFTNSTFIKEFNPYIILITDDGALGRKQRGSTQTERHIKSIATRVSNIKAHCNVINSEAALDLIKKFVYTGEHPGAPDLNSGPSYVNLFDNI